MKLLAIWYSGNRSMAKEASEDRLAHLLICWRRTPGSSETVRRQRWITGLAGGKESHRGLTEVDLVVVVVAAAAVVVVVVVVVVVAYCHLGETAGLIGIW